MPALAWNKFAKLLKKQGVTIQHRKGTGEVKLTKTIKGKVRIYVLQHKCCNSKTATVWSNHVSNIVSHFGLNKRDFR